MTLEAGTYAVEWFSVNSRETMGAGNLTAESSTPVRLNAPFETASPSVVFLKKI